MAKYVSRRDMLELLDDRYTEQKAGADSDGGAGRGAAGDGSGAAGDGSGHRHGRAGGKAANELMQPAGAQDR
eukprot:1216135-Prymnesium_polylepis.2